MTEEVEGKKEGGKKKEGRLFDITFQLLGKNFEPWEERSGEPVTVGFISANAVGSSLVSPSGQPEKLDEGQSKKRGKLWRKLNKHLKKIKDLQKDNSDADVPTIRIDTNENKMIQDCVLRGMDPFIYLQIYEFLEETDLGDE